VGLFAAYVMVCTVRLTMPGLETRTRNKIFLLRVGISIIGYLIGLGFISLCYHGILRRDQDFALDTAKFIFCLIAVSGEFVSRRILRKLDIFPKNKHIPWTY
jgi:hypothetical protein